jgi:hypothetical protein
MMRTRSDHRRKSSKMALMSAIVSVAVVGLAAGAELMPPAQAIPPAEGPSAGKVIPPPEPAPRAEVIPPAAPALVRVTSSFEVRHAGAVLKKVAKLFRAGFVRANAEELAKDIETLPAEQSRRWEFTVNYKGASYPLQIRARLDEFGMLDLDFFCAASAAGPVREAVDGYLNSHAL